MLFVSDVQRSVDFYKRLFGFKLIEGSKDYARLKSPRGNATIALHKIKDIHEGKGITLYFETEDIDGFCEQLIKQGVKFSEVPKVMPWGWKHAYLTDPDGYNISLYNSGSMRLKRAVDR